MDIKAIFAGFNSGKMQAHSELGSRDESKQTKNFGTRIQKMKTVTGINARCLVMKDVVIPFNPFTCEEDDMYTRKHPFRPILLVSQVITGIKMSCAENPELADKWEKVLNYRFEGTDANMTDYKAFKANGFIKTRIMSYATVKINFNGIFGFSEFSQKFTVPPEGLNENNSYDYGPQAPIWQQGATLFNMILKPEADEVAKKLQAEGANKETIAAQRRAIFAKSPVGFVTPTNLLPFFYFPFGEVPKTFDPKNHHAIEEQIRYYSYTDKWTAPLEEALSNPMFDTCMDFYDLHITTPSSNTKKASSGQVYTDEDSMELYQAMSIRTTDARLGLVGGSTDIDGKITPNEQVYASFMEAARAYFAYSQEQSSIDGGETFEKIMAASNRFRPITTVLDNFLPACNEVFSKQFAASPYFTESVRKSNSQFLIAMNPSNAVAMAQYDEEELEDAAESQRSDVNALISEANSGASLEDDAITALDFAEEK